jgi:hypothetical protein
MQMNQCDFIATLRHRAQAAVKGFQLQRNEHPIDIQHVDWWSRAIPLSHGCHSTGYTRTWPGQALLPVESRLEHAMLEALTSSDACVALATQPVTVHYLTNGIARSYTPDILVAYVCAKTKKLDCLLIEVKTKHQADRHRYKLEERQHAIMHATAFPLVIVTDDDLVALTSEDAA